jgi:uncharacterized repeat protein (TIGR02543 family)
MSGYRSEYVFLFLLFALALAPAISHAQYWFQSGAQGDQSTEFNTGASVQIETVTPQQISYGSFGYWVGETLSNGAFIQVGYEVPNQSGDFASNCSLSGCTGQESLTAGHASWFWEYFPANYYGQSFLGELGPDNSAGQDGTYNTYSFSSSGSVWNIYMNGQEIGSIDLGTDNSGPNPPSAIAEYADAADASQQMPDVPFKDLLFQQNGKFLQVVRGYTYIGYGKGSDKYLSNPYGVEEVGNQQNYFMIGSGIPVPSNYALLWSLGYRLNVVSQYGSTLQTGNYSAYSSVQLYEPGSVNVSSGERETFAGWTGTGTGSYTGPNPNATINMDGNITETARWEVQYYVNASTPYGLASGSGWYDANSTVRVALDADKITVGMGKRASFVRWSNGETAMDTSVLVNAPVDLYTTWVIQYLVNATTPYGNATGSGWYDNGSTAQISLSRPYVQTGSGSRSAFTMWNNGSNESMISFKVDAPVFLTALYRQQYMVTMQADDAYGNPINVSVMNVSGSRSYGTDYMFANRTYEVRYVNYKGVNVSVNYSISNVSYPKTVSFATPVYNVTIGARSYLGFPVGAQFNATFLNGTKVNATLGPSGEVKFVDVPYGYVSGYEDFFGQRQSIDRSYGGNAVVAFLTPVAVALIPAIVLVIILLERYYFSIRRAELRRAQKRRAGKAGK